LPYFNHERSTLTTSQSDKRMDIHSRSNQQPRRCHWPAVSRWHNNDHWDNFRQLDTAGRPFHSHDAIFSINIPESACHAQQQYKINYPRSISGRPNRIHYIDIPAAIYLVKNRLSALHDKQQ